jgi:glutaconate CoA-transferase subunit A
VLTGVDEAAGLIRNGDVIIVGGFGTVNHPMPIIRGLIRRKVKNLTVVGAATAGLEIDLLIGAGAVRKVIAPYIGAELYAPIGHCFRRAAENGEVEVYETTEYLLYSQLDAAARGLGFLPWRGGVGTSIPVLNPDYVPFKDPIHGEPYLAVPALHADWAIIHVGQADVYGNGQHGGARFGDRLLSRAAERVMLTAERIVPNSEIRKNPWATSVAYADVVVEAPYGSHPFASHGFYVEDDEAIQEYVSASSAFRRREMRAWDAYLDRWVTGVTTHADYLARLSKDRLAKLESAVHA